jgi:uncharacterized phage protein (TIGR01671 family)
MREIKFQYGFNSVNGIVKKVYYLHEIPFMHDKCDVWNILPLVYVHQFTGLKDKNGLDIYQNDIFHCNKVNYVLKYLTCGGAYTVHNIKDDSDERFLHHCNTQIEVIGNIYETPELLNK